MHYCYLVETYDKPDPVSVGDGGVIDGLIDPYYYECEPDHVNWDWCEVGGRWDGEIPGNCCPGSDIPSDFEPYGLICDWGVIDLSWDDPEFWDRYDGMTQEERLSGIRERDEEAARRFAEDFRIHPDRWYTLVDFHS